MERNIVVDNTRCIGCGRCVKLCPSALFSSVDGTVSVQSKGCIGCGHCVAACPVEAISHSDFPPGTVHSFDRTSLPDAASLMTLIKGRRSNRLFSGRDIPADVLSDIVEAGRYAPTATNSREVKMLLVTDADTIKRISQFTIDTYSSILRLIDNPVVRPLLKVFSPATYGYIGAFRRLKREHEAGNDRILRNARAVVIYYAPAGSRFGCQDANLAYQNSSLMAEAHGVAHFYTGFVCVAASMKKNVLQKMLGIRGTVHAGMALSMPAYKFDKYVERS